VKGGEAKRQRKSQAILQKERNTPKETDEMKSLFNFKMTTPALVNIFPLVFLALSPIAQAVVPPPDGGYPGGNTAEGQNALFSLTAGGFNTAVGFLSLRSDTLGQFNTGVGAGTLLFNVGDPATLAGIENTATGAGALLNNSTGGANTANGAFALFSNTTSNRNTAIGDRALFSHTAGFGNTAVGHLALYSNTAGEGNTALGDFAGYNVSTASGVICIGSLGVDVSNTTWIGNIYAVATQSGVTAPVIVSNEGQLGTVASTERVKKDIAAMDKASKAILSLRPVTFHYKSDARETPQFGLIAEEVAKVNPTLVLPDKEGKPYTVRYDAVNAMLLNEFLKEHKKVQHQETKIGGLEATAAKQEATITGLKSTVARQAKAIDVMTARLEEQVAQLQKVSAQIEANKPQPQLVLNSQ
jgi:uncharacterized coiled-coil protein SlyX